MVKRNPVCKACGEGRLYRKRPRRWSMPVVRLGYVVLIPAVLAAASGLYVLVGSLLMESSLQSNGSPDQQLGFFAARAGIFRLLLPSLVVAALGWSMIRRREAWICSHCNEAGQV